MLKDDEKIKKIAGKLNEIEQLMNEYNAEAGKEILRSATVIAGIKWSAANDIMLTEMDKADIESVTKYDSGATIKRCWVYGVELKCYEEKGA